MIRLRVAYPLALALAAAGIFACSGGTPTPDGGGTDAPATDTPVNPDGGGNDTGGDVIHTDGGTDGDASGPLCNTLHVENLNALGTVNATDHMLHYTSNNMGTAAGPVGGIQVPGALQVNGTNPGLCAFKIGHQRVFSYTAMTTSVLRVSTSNPGTDVFFDTVLYVADASGAMAAQACRTTGPTATFLGCNDDDPNFSGDQRRISSTAVTIKQVQATAGHTVYIALGGFVPASSAQSRDQTREVGNFELTVQEVPVLADSMPCDTQRVANACSDTSTCVSNQLPSTMGMCQPDGTVAGSACAGGACTGTGLTCDATTNLCVTTAADGSPCDNTYTTCGPNSTCVIGGERGSIAGVCRANGTAAGTACSTTPPDCAAGLTCADVAGVGSFCLISATTSCNTFDSSCPQNTAMPQLNQDCVATSPTGTGGTCMVTDTTVGTRCAGSCPTPLTCDMNSNLCANSRNAPTPGQQGDACGPNDVCATGTTCYLDDLNDVFHGHCWAQGFLGGACNTTGTACNTPAVCSNMGDPANGRCINQVADGMHCDNLTGCSGTNSVCVPDPASATGPLSGTCRSQGTAGAQCRRMMTPTCDSGFTCSSYIPEEGICQTNGTAGGMCDARYGSIRCPSGQVCRSHSMHAQGTCAAPVTEPNAANNDAPAASLPAQPSGTAIQGSLSFFDIDCYRVTVPAAGRLYATATSPSGNPGALNLFIDVYQIDSTLTPPQARLIGTDNNGGVDRCPRVEGGDANGNYPWAVNGGTSADWYVCVSNANPDRLPVSSYVLSLAVN